jgi:hypothetical protein
MKIFAESEQEKQELLAISQYLHDFTFYNEPDKNGNALLTIITKMTHQKTLDISDTPNKSTTVYESKPEITESFQINTDWYSLDLYKSPVLNYLAHLYVYPDSLEVIDHQNYEEILYDHFSVIAEHDGISIEEAIQKYYILQEQSQNNIESELEKKESIPIHEKIQQMTDIQAIDLLINAQNLHNIAQSS